MYQKDNRAEEDKVEGKIHYTQDGNIGFPASGFHSGMGECGVYLGIDKKRIRGSVKFLDPMVPIEFKKRCINITWGRTAGRNASPRKIVRPEFQGWSCELRISYNKNAISAEQIVNLINYAGFQIGVGGWRPTTPSGKTPGSYGQYKVRGDIRK